MHIKFIPKEDDSEWDHLQGFAPKEWASYSKVDRWGQKGFCESKRSSLQRGSPVSSGATPGLGTEPRPDFVAEDVRIPKTAPKGVLLGVWIPASRPLRLSWASNEPWFALKALQRFTFMATEIVMPRPPQWLMHLVVQPWDPKFSTSSYSTDYPSASG